MHDSAIFSQLSVRPELSNHGDELIPLCAFRIGENDYVIDLMRVRKVTLFPEIVPISNAPEGVEGVANLHGMLVPMIDPRWLLDAAGGGPRRKPIYLICKIAKQSIGLRVDAIMGGVRVSRSSIQKFTCQLSLPESRFLLGFQVAQGGHIRRLLNIKALVMSLPWHLVEPAKKVP